MVPASGDLLAFAVPRPGAQLAREDLDARCLEHMGRFELPKRYEIVGSLPKNDYGKALKRGLREQLRQRARWVKTCCRAGAPRVSGPVRDRRRASRSGRCQTEMPSCRINWLKTSRSLAMVVRKPSPATTSGSALTLAKRSFTGSPFMT